MICAIHQPNFLPWEGFFYKISRADVFVILDNVDIVLGSSKAITNRTTIKTHSGPQWITLPLRKNESKKILDQRIIEGNWREKMLKAVDHSYRKSKFYADISPLIEDIIMFDSNNLVDYNVNGIERICAHLEIDTRIIKASSLDLDSKERNQRIIDICNTLNAETYFSGNGGKKYHEENLFIQQGISIEYSDFKSNPYNQLYGEFIPGLSIIDKLFNENINFQWK